MEITPTMDKQRLKSVYHQTKDALSAVNQQRKVTQRFQKLVWAITGLLMVLMLFNMLSHYIPLLQEYRFALFQPSANNPYAQLYPFIGLMVLLYLSTSIFSNRFANFKQIEAKTITQMVQSLFPNVEFSLNTFVPKKEIIKSKLFSNINDKAPIYSYGQIRSSNNELSINIADIGIVEKKTTHQLKALLLRIPFLNFIVIFYDYVLKNLLTNQSAEAVQYTFRGLFCWLSFKKKLKGHTVILTNAYPTQINRYFSHNFKEEQQVQLEDPRFSTAFIVYSTDQVEARYVLSIALMERILLLQEKFKRPIILSFHHQQVFIAIENKNGVFSFPSGNLSSFEVLEELALNIEAAQAIPTELKLN
jgi:hypothetical protein